MSDKPASSFGTLLLKGLFFVIIIAGGVYLGFWLSVKTGLTDAFAENHDTELASNRSNVHIGDIFPPLTVTAPDSAEIDIRTLLSGHKTLLAFVSGTCEPCVMLAEEAVKWNRVVSGDIQVIYLTRTPEFFRDNPALIPGGVGSFTVCEYPSEVLGQLELNVFPTIYLINESGEVRSAVSGFSRSFTEEQLLSAL